MWMLLWQVCIHGRKYSIKVIVEYVSSIEECNRIPTASFKSHPKDYIKLMITVFSFMIFFKHQGEIMKTRKGIKVWSEAGTERKQEQGREAEAIANPNNGRLHLEGGREDSLESSLVLCVNSATSKSQMHAWPLKIKF